MRSSVVLLLPALGGSLGAPLSARAGGPTDVAVLVDATAPGPAFEPVWAYFGYDEVNTTTTLEGERLLSTLAAAFATPVSVRTHFLFNTGDGTPSLKWGSTNLYTEDDAGRPVYDFTLIDQIMDATLSAGARPFFELGFMPQALSTQPEPYRNSDPYTLDGGSFHPPRDYERWAALVSAWASHVRERYPDAESSWQWELWNEPDIGYWQGTFEEYAMLYDHTQAALHAVMPTATLGGPAVANPDNGFLARFLEHCAAGDNAVSGQTGTRLDLVSFHAKGGVTIMDGHVQMDLGNQLRLHRAGFEIVAASAFADTPVVISEADPDGCAACPVSSAPHHAYRNSSAYGAYELGLMKRSLELAEQAKIELSGVLTWAFTFPGSEYFAGYRALSTNGIHLPVLGAFQLLGRLRGERLPVTSSGALPLADLLARGVRELPDVDALADLQRDRIQVLVWNYHDDLVEVPPTPVALELRVPPSFGERLSVTHERVDDAHGNAFTVWQAQGSPQPPSASQLTALRDAMHPVVLGHEQVVREANGVVHVAFELPRFGISMLTFEPAPAPQFEAGPREPPNSAGADAGCAQGKPESGREGASAALWLALGFVLCLGRRRAEPS